MLLKKEDPEFYKSIKEVIPHLPDIREHMATIKEFQGGKERDWDPWKAIHDEHRSLLKGISMGSRPEWLALLDLIQEDVELPEELLGSLDEILKEFSTLLPILTFLYTKENSNFHWMIVEADILGPFELSNTIKDPTQRIPSFIDHNNALSHFSKIHRLEIFEYEVEAIEDVFTQNEFKGKYHQDIVMKIYLRGIDRFTHPDWIDITLRILHIYKRIFPQNLFKLMLRVIDTGNEITNDLQNLGDRMTLYATK